MNPDADEVDDLYGSVFLALFEDNFARLRSFKGKNDYSLASWIRLLSSRKTLDHLREKSRRAKLIDYSGGTITDGVPSADDTEEKTFEAERAELAKKAMLRLSAEEVAFLHLYYERELPPEKVADILSGMRMVAEGVRNTRAVKTLASRQGIELPIVDVTYSVLYEGLAPTLSGR